MLKKVILTSALSLVFLTGWSGVRVQEQTTSVQTSDYQEEVTTLQTDATQELAVDEVTSEPQEGLTQAEKVENIKENDSWGGAITLMSMCIVLFALIVLSLLFLGFGKATSSVLSKRKREAQGITASDDNTDAKENLDSGETIAAIAAALAQHFSGKHDMEDTILTIRRMKRAYSPWNSKIYNMRQVPTVKKSK